MNPFVLLVVGLMTIGLYIVLSQKNLVKVLMGLALMETAVNILIVAMGYTPGGTAPILSDGVASGAFVDPLPQALVLTAIVIGVSILALALSLVVRHFQATGEVTLEYDGRWDE